MALKDSKEIMHSMLMTKEKLTYINSSISEEINSEITPSKKLIESRKHASYSIKTVFDKLNNGTKLYLFSVNPICTFYVNTTTNQFNKARNGINFDIWNKGLNVSIKNFSNFYPTDLLKWISFLNSKKITSNISYMVALHNLGIITDNVFTYKFTTFYNIMDFKLCNRARELDYLYKNLTSSLEKAKYANEKERNNYLRKAIKVNELIRQISDSKQNIYLSSYSEDKVHKQLNKNAFRIQKFILQDKTSNSKAIICPHCHTYTYSCFNYCQNCGAKIK